MSVCRKLAVVVVVLVVALVGVWRLVPSRHDRAWAIVKPQACAAYHRGLAQAVPYAELRAMVGGGELWSRITTDC